MGHAHDMAGNCYTCQDVAVMSMGYVRDEAGYFCTHQNIIVMYMRHAYSKPGNYHTCTEEVLRLWSVAILELVTVIRRDGVMSLSVHAHKEAVCSPPGTAPVTA